MEQASKTLVAWVVELTAAVLVHRLKAAARIVCRPLVELRAVLAHASVLGVVGVGLGDNESEASYSAVESAMRWRELDDLRRGRLASPSKTCTACGVATPWDRWVVHCHWPGSDLEIAECPRCRGTGAMPHGTELN